MHVILGSQNAAKLTATQNAVHAYWPEATVIGIDIPSGVSVQPIGDAETLQGALNRARGALASANGQAATLGVGIEGGVTQLHGQWVMMSYIAITDGTREIAIPGGGTPIPATWGDALANGAELRPFVIQSGLAYDYKAGVNGILTHGKLNRNETFAASIMAALVPWVNPTLF